jgi:hypothetical protein
MDLGVWDAVFVQAPLHDDGERGVRLWLDLHARRDGGRFTGIVRPAVGWDLTDRTSLFAGYAAIPSGSPGATGSATFEHRAWQQLLWSSPAGPLTVGLRPRLEQRFAAGNAPALRARMFGRAQAPLSDPFAVVVWDEAFVALNDSEFGPAGFDQNRLFVGPAVSGPSHRVEIGVLHQLLRRQGAWTAVGVAAANLFVTL